MKTKEKPSVSVVVPVYNDENLIIRVLESLDKQKYKDFDVFVVDDGSTDNTSEKVKSFIKGKEKFNYLRNKKNLGKGKTYNKGIMASDGEIVLMLHSDCIPQKNDWIKKMVRHFKDEKIGAVAARNTAEFKNLGLIDRLFIPTYFLLGSLKGEVKVEEIDSFSDKHDAYRRSVLQEVGYFDTSFKKSAEDTDLAEKIKNAGYKIILEPSPVKQLLGSEQVGLKNHFKKTIQYSEGEAEIFRRFRVSTDVNHAFFFILSILSFGYLFFQSNLYLPLFILVLFVFGLYHKSFLRFMAWVLPIGFLMAYLFGNILNPVFVIFGGWLVFCFGAAVRIFYYSYSVFEVPLWFSPLGVSLLFVREILKAPGFLKGVFIPGAFVKK